MRRKRKKKNKINEPYKNATNTNFDLKHEQTQNFSPNLLLGSTQMKPYIYHDNSQNSFSALEVKGFRGNWL